MRFIVLNCQVVRRVDIFANPVFKNPGTYIFTSLSSCRKDQFAVSYFSTSLIVLSQVYNWEIRHNSLVCCSGLADILYILKTL